MTMSNTDETLSAILSEMRDRADTIVNGRAITERNFVPQETVEDWADRIEAAVKRELEENESWHSIARGFAVHAAMREAAVEREHRLLRSCARWIHTHDIYGHMAPELLAECKAVLRDNGEFLFPTPRHKEKQNDR